MKLNRRQVLAAAATAAGSGALAGCTDDGSAAESATTVTTTQASFFVFGDIAEHVAGDAATAELLVPVGQHGHGWEPGPRVREAIRDADLFVHGMTGFQPWVDDITADLDADGADVATVDASADVDLLAISGGHDEPAGEHDTAHDGDHNETEADSDHTETAHNETAHDGHNETAHTEETDHHSDEEHDHGSGMDPHFWMDPLRVKTATDTVQQALGTVAPDNAETYADNAAAFQDDLDELHEQIESTVADASGDVLLVAGHNAFQYLSDRYDVTVASLTNISPDDRPTTRDIQRAQRLIETHNLQYICADPLESQQAATQLVADTDAEAVLPLTAIPGLTDEWEQDGLGYIEIMETVNLPTLERVFDA